MVPNANDDLPAPEIPVNATSASRGATTSTPRRLWTRVPYRRTQGSMSSVLLWDISVIALRRLPTLRDEENSLEKQLTPGRCRLLAGWSPRACIADPPGGRDSNPHAVSTSTRLARYDWTDPRAPPQFPGQSANPDAGEQAERCDRGHVWQRRQGRRGGHSGCGAIDGDLSVVTPSVGNITEVEQRHASGKCNG